MNKKAVSPLVATVLLIGFTIALAGVVMIWGQSFFEGQGVDPNTGKPTTTTLNAEGKYFLGLVRGCDLGCIDYDLRINNFTWDTPEKEYDILNSTNYRKCSEYCIKSFGREN